MTHLGVEAPGLKAPAALGAARRAACIAVVGGAIWGARRARLQERQSRGFADRQGWLGGAGEVGAVEQVGGHWHWQRRARLSW